MKIFKKGQIPQYEFEMAIKKPIPIRCFQIDEDFIVETMEGNHHGKPGDFLMVGIKGEMYPCDREIFYKTYEIVKK